MPLLPPRGGVARADSAVVRQVRAEEEAVEREEKDLAGDHALGDGRFQFVYSSDRNVIKSQYEFRNRHAPRLDPRCHNRS